MNARRATFAGWDLPRDAAATTRRRWERRIAVSRFGVWRWKNDFEFPRQEPPLADG
jgi:hypothetical protein